MYWLYIWLGVTALSLIIEFLTNEMVSIWFAGGGIVAMIISAVLHDYWYIHLPAFIVVSLVLLLCFRKTVLKLFDKGESRVNADAAIGKEFRLLSAIDFNQVGTIRVNDVVWNAVTEHDGDIIAEGELVRVTAIKGNKYIVEKV